MKCNVLITLLPVNIILSGLTKNILNIIYKLNFTNNILKKKSYYIIHELNIYVLIKLQLKTFETNIMEFYK